jgi:hypothetical protein
MMMKLRQTVIAVTLAFPLLASAQSATQMQSEIDALKAQIKELQDMVKGRAAAAVEPEPTVPLEEFNRIKTKVEAAEDRSEINGMKGLRISGGIDPVWIYNDAKGTSSFSFGNPTAGDGFTYDNGTFGIAYLDIQKEMEGGTKFHLALAPTKSVASTYNLGSIIQEASASIPLTDAQTRLMVGQMGDVSGYEPQFNTYVGANNISSNLLYPTYAEYFVTKNLLFDFTAAYFYTGVGLDLVRGPWETKLFLANFNSGRNDVVLSNSAIVGDSNAASTPAFIFNATYAQDEFWGFEFTGYVVPSAQTPTLGRGRMEQFEIDGNYTRGDFNGNLQFTVGTQQSGTFDGLNDSKWYGLSALISERLGSQWIIAGRADYIYNQDNGGGIYSLTSAPIAYTSPPNPQSVTNPGGVVGDVLNGFGPDVNDPTTGTNRAALTVAATYRLNPYAALRAELRRDFATTSAFYNFTNGTFQSTNSTVALSAIVNF